MSSQKDVNRCRSKLFPGLSFLCRIGLRMPVSQRERSQDIEYTTILVTCSYSVFCLLLTKRSGRQAFTIPSIMTQAQLGNNVRSSTRWTRRKGAEIKSWRERMSLIPPLRTHRRFRGKIEGVSCRRFFWHHFCIVRPCAICRVRVCSPITTTACTQQSGHSHATL